MRKDLTPQEWQQLEQHLSRPLNTDSKHMIFDVVNLFDVLQATGRAYPSLTEAPLRKRLMAFKAEAEALIPKPFTPLSEQAQQQMNHLFKGLPSDIKARLSHPIFLMARNANTENLHPSQYHSAAIIALEKLAQESKKAANNPKGAGNSEANTRLIFERIWGLWHGLGETDDSVTYTDTKTSKIVSFGHALLEIIGNPKSLSTVRQGLTKGKKNVN